MPKLATTSSLSTYPKLAITQYKDRLPANAITLDYSYRGKPYRYDVAVTRTACNYGNYRYWWLCPKCGRRVGVLYCAGAFVCRHCINTPYQTQLMQPLDKLFRKVEKIRHRLGWQAGIANGNQGRPKGMHFTTYWRLVDEHNRIVENICGTTCQRMGITLPNQK